MNKLKFSIYSWIAANLLIGPVALAVDCGLNLPTLPADCTYNVKSSKVPEYNVSATELDSAYKFMCRDNNKLACTLCKKLLAAPTMGACGLAKCIYEQVLSKTKGIINESTLSKDCDSDAFKKYLLTDVNECQSQVCDKNAECTNTYGGYTCACKPGFNGDGKTCTSNFATVPAPTANPPSPIITAVCGNKIIETGEKCDSDKVTPGFTCTNNCTTETDINECTNGTAGCHANATCKNTLGNYECTCNAGFTGNGKVCTANAVCGNNIIEANEKCDSSKVTPGFTCTNNCTTETDIDECVNGTAGCDANATCKNIPGSSECTCKAGFNGNGKVCSAIPSDATPGFTCKVNIKPIPPTPGFTCKVMKKTP